MQSRRGSMSIRREISLWWCPLSTLIHDAQEIAILNGREVLNLESLNEAYQQRAIPTARVHPART